MMMMINLIKSSNDTTVLANDAHKKKVRNSP